MSQVHANPDDLREFASRLQACWRALAGLVLLALAEHFPVVILSGIGVVLAIRLTVHSLVSR